MSVKVSVLMAIHNGERYLRPAIESILTQTFTDFEFIIIDDGSTDQSPAILREYEKADPRVRLFRRGNTGLTIALNESAALAGGEYLARMDGDDIALPERFQKQVKFLDENLNVAVVGSDARLIDGETLTDSYVRVPRTSEEIKSTLTEKSAFVHPSVMMRASAFNEVGGYCPAMQLAQDYDLWLRLSEKYDLANLPDVLLHYRMHDYQVTNTSTVKQTLSHIAAQTAAARRRTGKPDPLKNLTQIDRESLLSIGVAPARIESEFLDLMEERIAHAINLGRITVADELVRVAADTIDQWSGSNRSRSHFNFLKAKVLLAKGERMHSVRPLMNACISSPWLVMRLIQATGRRIASIF